MWNLALKKNYRNSTPYALLAVLGPICLLLFGNCTGPSGQGGQGTPQFIVKDLGQGVFSSGLGDFTYKLLELTNDSGGQTYAAWFAPQAPEKSALLWVDPYSGINWSGNSVDLKWALRSAGSYPDEDGPAYSPSTSKNIFYSLRTVDEVASEAVVFLINKMGLLLVFGRYYAGGDILNDAHDVVAGLNFLGRESSVDPTRIGVYGASWGGFEALHGSANSKIQPALVMAKFPPLDMGQFKSHIINFLPTQVSDPAVLTQYQDFFEPYLRRINAQSGLLGNSFFSGAKLSGSITGDILIFHDEWDNLVPFTMSENFISASSSPRIQGFWFPHSSAVNYNGPELNHSFSAEGYNFYSAMTFGYAFVFSRFDTDQKVVFYDTESAPNDNGTFFSYIRAQQLAGKNIDWLVPRLLDLCSDGLLMYRPGFPALTGREYVAQILNNYWGRSLTASSVVDHLNTLGL